MLACMLALEHCSLEGGEGFLKHLGKVGGGESEGRQVQRWPHHTAHKSAAHEGGLGSLHEQGAGNDVGPPVHVS